MQTILVLHRLRWWIRKTHWIFINIVWLILSRFTFFTSFELSWPYKIWYFYMWRNTFHTAMYSQLFLENFNFRIWWQSLYKKEVVGFLEKFSNSINSLELGSWDCKVHIFREGHKILQNLHRRFDCYYIGQIEGGDFTK